MDIPHGVENIAKWGRASKMVKLTNPKATAEDVLVQYKLLGGLVLGDNASIRAGDEDVVQIPRLEKRLAEIAETRPKTKKK